jgi:hypothetical protein
MKKAAEPEMGRQPLFSVFLNAILQISLKRAERPAW